MKSKKEKSQETREKKGKQNAKFLSIKKSTTAGNLHFL